MTATARAPQTGAGLSGDQLDRLDRFVARSRAVADAFRSIRDQDAVDGISGGRTGTRGS